MTILSRMISKNNYRYNFKHIIFFLILIRLFQFIIVFLTPFQFDTSSSILIDRYKSNNPRYPQFLITCLNNLISWDSVYFLKLSIDKITFEHEWVFGPLWWRLMNFLINQSFLKQFNVDIYDVSILFIIINTMLLLITTKILYNITYFVCNSNLKYLPNNFDIYKCSYYSSLLLIIQPSGIFSVICYSETSVQCLCYLALYLYLSSRSRVAIQNKILYFLSGTLLSISFGFRSNVLLYGLIYIYDLIFNFRNLTDILCILTTGLQLFISLIYSNVITYQLYCPDRGEWCNSSTKSLVFYAQSHYWNNGFLRYFTIGNLPLFLIALPQFLIISLSIWNLRNFITIKPILLTSSVYLFLQLTSMHVQIINRISTFLPTHLLYVSYLLTLNDNKLGKAIVRWWIVWVLIQTALFSAFLPPA